MAGFFLEILSEGTSTLIENTDNVDVEVLVTHSSVVSEMPGPESIEIQTPVSVRSDYAISATEPTDPGVLIWYKIA